MEVTFKLEREDYWRYNKFVFERVPGLKWKAYILPLVVSIYLMFAVGYLHIASLVWSLFFGAVVFGLFLSLLAWARKRVYIKTVEGNPGALGLHTLALGHEGIRQQSPVILALVKWPQVTEIAENPDLIVFLLSPRYGFLVPKRAFPTAEEAQAFLETARAYHRGALNGTAPLLPEIPTAWPPAPQRLSD